MTVTVETVDEAAALRNGGRDAFDALFRRHGTTVLRYALKLTGSPADAEELVQDTFLTLWAKHRSVETAGGSLLPWMLVTCRHHGANMLRKKQKRQQGVVSLSDALDQPAPEESPEWGWLRSAIDELPDSDRALIVRCLIEGVPYGVAAAELGITVAAVAKRVQRLRAHLRHARSEN